MVGHIAEDKCRSLLGEEAEAALDVGLVLGTAQGGGDAQGIAGGGVDLGGEIAGFVVEEESDGGTAGGGGAFVEGGDDGGGVFVVADVDADGGRGVGVDGQL